jgi:heptosyltransferase-2
MRSRTVPHRTVIFRLSSIGDILLTTPFIRALRKAAGPDAQIDFVVKEQYADLVRYNPHLSVIHTLESGGSLGALFPLAAELRKQRYEVVFDLHRSLRTVALRTLLRSPREEVINKRTLHRWQLVHWKCGIGKGFPNAVERYCELLIPYGIQPDDNGLEITIPGNILRRTAEQVTARVNPHAKVVIGICPGARHFTKRWPWEKYVVVAQRLIKEAGASILLFGGHEERDVCERIARQLPAASVLNLAGPFSILETAAAMDACAVVVTNDSGLMHLAAARKRPVVALFGSTTRELGFFPYGTKSIVVEEVGLSCRPCSHIGLDHCPEKHFRCMLDLGVDEVVGAAQRLMSGR